MFYRAIEKEIKNKKLNKYIREKKRKNFNY